MILCKPLITVEYNYHLLEIPADMETRIFISFLLLIYFLPRWNKDMGEKLKQVIEEFYGKEERDCLKSSFPKNGLGK